MTKTISTILDAVTAPLTFVDRDLGNIVRTAIFTVGGFILLGGPQGAAIGFSLGQALAGLNAPIPRPDTTESSIKFAIPPRARAYGRLRLFGAWILYGHKEDGTPIDVWAFHDGRANAILQVYLNDDKPTIVGDTVQAMEDGRYADDRVRAGYNLGLPTETAFATLVAQLPGIWTTDHRGDNVVTGYLVKFLTSSKKFLTTYPNGDDIQMSLAGEWAPVFDPRDGAQDPADRSTWLYSGSPNPGENGVLALLHYFLTQRSVDYTTRILPQIASWIAAADDCDEAQTLAVGGTEPRYRISLAYKATDEPASVVAGILATFDGWLCENERGELIVHSGRFSEPVVGIGPAEIVAYHYQRYVAGEDAVNEITIQYVAEDLDYNTVDADAWRNEDAISASGREPVSQPLGAQIPSFTQGRRLAKRKMARLNAPHRGSVTTTYAGRVVFGQRFINLRIEEAGALFYDGPVEITAAERNMQTGGVTFEWVSVSPDIDDWDPETEDSSGAPVGELPDIEPTLPSPVLNLSVSANEDGSLIVTDWDDSDHATRYLVELIVEP